jgi:phosphoribosylanthranilate isomerase
MLVKICGITSAVDARLALDAGADWIGLNFVEGPRKITVDAARRILAATDDPQQVVALMRFGEQGPVRPDPAEIHGLGVRRLQL